jgi:hypothetical protein
MSRLLPWESAEGKPCFVVGDGTGPVSRLADDVETVQLAMAADLMGHADEMLADPNLPYPQLRYVTTCLHHSLRALHRIARSRGDRLAAVVGDREGEGAG